MSVQKGTILISKEGHYYRVLECDRTAVSLMRINGYTIFACRPEYIEGQFRSL